MQAEKQTVVLGNGHNRHNPTMGSHMSVVVTHASHGSLRICFAVLKRSGR
jgi:hypothetical protein